MAFGWFKKNKNKSPPEPAEEQVAEVQEDEEPAPEAEGQKMAPGEIPASEDHIAGPERTADDDFSDEPAEDATAAPEAVGYFKRLKNRLSKSRRNLSDGFEKAFAGKKKLDEDTLEELEELLITSDIGVKAALEIVENLRAAIRKADFATVRGKFAFAANQHPVQDLYIREVVKDADGTYTNKTLKAVFTDHSNVYLKDCKLD